MNIKDEEMKKFNPEDPSFKTWHNYGFCLVQGHFDSNDLMDGFGMVFLYSEFILFGYFTKNKLSKTFFILDA
jgi:hypothetical protein